MGMTVQIRLEDTDVPLVNRLREVTGQRTASGAYQSAATQFLRLTIHTAEQDERIEIQALEIARLTRIVEGARTAAALLLEKTAQGDLL